MLILLPLFHL